MNDAVQPAIDVKGLVKRYGKRTVVDQVDLKIMPGRICGFLGPNGSGKTTTLRMICGLLTPDAGSGTCLGHDLITGRDAIKRQTGYMTQKFGLYEDLTIRENLEFVAVSTFSTMPVTVSTSPWNASTLPAARTS
jgi:ABC-2 type transport system ATP-binding protein